MAASDLNSSAFLAALSDERDRLNALFAYRRQAGARLDEAAVLHHLSVHVAPLVDAVHAQFPERARGALVTLFELLLDLTAASLFGDPPKHPHVMQLWSDVLPGAARLLARDPQRVSGSLSNAVHNLSTQPGTRPELWLQRMRDVAPRCDSVAQLLDAGHVAAWQAGMVQYRNAALQTLEQFSPVPGALALGFEWQGDSAKWENLVRRLREDRWETVERACRDSTRPRKLQCVATAGRFRGFGGLFLQPPTVCEFEHHLYVSDGERQWLLLADAFGTYFEPLSHPPWGKKKKPAASSEVKVTRDGTVRWGTRSGVFPQLASPSSTAGDGITLGVTIPTSFHVFLLADMVIEP